MTCMSASALMGELGEGDDIKSDSSNQLGLRKRGFSSVTFLAAMQLGLR
jgi:hypothetical protein